jgi:hypothetical protein
MGENEVLPLEQFLDEGSHAGPEHGDRFPARGPEIVEPEQCVPYGNGAVLPPHALQVPEI